MKTLIPAGIRCSLMFMAVAALSIAQPAKANLIQNGGFEDGNFNHWSTSGIVSVERTVGGIAPHSGRFQAVIGNLGGGISQMLTLAVGTTYHLDFFFAQNQGIGFFEVVLNGAAIFFMFPGPTPVPYGEYSVDFTATTNNAILSFSGEVERGGHAFQLLDDISVEPAGVGVPDGGSTVSLLGCTLFGVAALRRRLSC